MRSEFRQLNVRTSVANGVALLVDRFLEQTFQCFGTFVADLRIEISNDGSTWVEVHQFTGAGIYCLSSSTCRYVRVRTAAFTSGTPVVWFGGSDRRAL